MNAPVTVGAVMRPEWFEPFERSMAELGAVAVWLGRDTTLVSEESLSEVDGLVLELSHEVIGTVSIDEVRSWNSLAGVPVEDGSAALAEQLGISEVLWGEDQARAWLESRQAPLEHAPAPLLVVWGTAGAPGATTLAIGLSLELAKYRPTLLIDADFFAPSVGELLGIPHDSSGLLGALRVARNDNPAWESMSACAAPAAHNASLQVLSGIRPGSLGRLEAAGVSTLIDSALSSGVAVVVDLKCALGDSEPTPEKAATEAILRKAQHLLWVGTGTDLGVSRLVREWTLLEELIEDVDQTFLLRMSEGSSESSFMESSTAVWGFTGCSDISALPMRNNLSDTSELTDLLHVAGGISPRSLPAAKAPRKGLRASLSSLLTAQHREPLP
jgi:hypothetical protein